MLSGQGYRVSRLPEFQGLDPRLMVADYSGLSEGINRGGLSFLDGVIRAPEYARAQRLADLQLEAQEAQVAALPESLDLQNRTGQTNLQAARQRLAILDQEQELERKTQASLAAILGADPDNLQPQVQQLQSAVRKHYETFGAMPTREEARNIVASIQPQQAFTEQIIEGIGKIVVGPDGNPVNPNMIIPSERVATGFTAVPIRDADGDLTGQSVIVDRAGGRIGLMPQPQRDTAAEQRIDRIAGTLMEDGTFTDPNQAKRVAIGIADGRIRVSRNEVTGATEVIDLATGERVGPRRPEDQSESGEGERARPAISLWEMSTGSTGIIPAARSQAQRLTGQFGINVASGDLIQSRQAFATETTELIRALSVNPRFPVSEMERIRQEINILPNAFLDETTLRNNMRSIDRSLRNRVQAYRQAARDASLPADTRRAFAQGVTNIENFLDVLGVPQSDSAPTPPRPADATPAPDWLSDEDKKLWPYMTEEERRKLEQALNRGGSAQPPQQRNAPVMTNEEFFDTIGFEQQ